MPHKRVPSLRLHKATQTAYVELSGHRIYLCKWEHPERDARYHALLAQWERAGRRYPFDALDTPPPQNDISVVEVLAAYAEHARQYYVHADGTPTGQIDRVMSALQGVRDLFADIPAVEFGPVKLDAVRARWIANGLSRSTINSMTGCVKLCFKWAAEKEMIPASVYHGLSVLGGLKAGRTAAKEPEPIRPVLDAHVDAIKPFVSRQVWAMIELQRRTACRPGEICGLKNDGTIDRTGKVWSVTLATHKNAYRGKQRTLYFGPQAQEVLRPWLMERPIGSYLFSPQEAETARYAAARSHRRPDQKLAAPKTSRRWGDSYSERAYAHAIRWGVIKHNARAQAEGRPQIPHWSPLQLRHTAATRIRQEYGLEAAQVALGHAQADVTQIYAETNQDRARDVFARMG
jgi:integrase